jgi:hypothetical protein
VTTKRLDPQERHWRAEEKDEWDAELAEANRHRPDCLCRAVHNWTPGPACYQQETLVCEEIAAIRALPAPNKKGVV